jgi:hypothetical protein
MPSGSGGNLAGGGSGGSALPRPLCQRRKLGWKRLLGQAGAVQVTMGGGGPAWRDSWAPTAAAAVSHLHTACTHTGGRSLQCKRQWWALFRQAAACLLGVAALATSVSQLWNISPPSPHPPKSHTRPHSPCVLLQLRDHSPCAHQGGEGGQGEVSGAHPHHQVAPRGAQPLPQAGQRRDQG